MSQAGPLIESAALAAGHDGQAEVVLALRFPNGALRSASFSHDAIGPALDRAGITDLDSLVGQPWSVLVNDEAPSTDHSTVPTTTTAPPEDPHV